LNAIFPLVMLVSISLSKYIPACIVVFCPGVNVVVSIISSIFVCFIVVVFVYFVGAIMVFGECHVMARLFFIVCGCYYFGVFCVFCVFYCCCFVYFVGAIMVFGECRKVAL